MCIATVLDLFIPEFINAQWSRRSTSLTFFLRSLESISIERDTYIWLQSSSNIFRYVRICSRLSFGSVFRITILVCVYLR